MTYAPNITLNSNSRFTDETAAADPSLDFNSRATYLDWVAAWKTALAENSGEIHRLKAIRRDKERGSGIRSDANYERQKLRVVGFNLIQLRLESKKKSALQWSAERAILLEAA
jgi:hypothetical protein